MMYIVAFQVVALMSQPFRKGNMHWKMNEFML